MIKGRPGVIFFFFNYTATTEIYTLSLHDALPISPVNKTETTQPAIRSDRSMPGPRQWWASHPLQVRSEEHTSELQSQSNLVCRLLLEKKKKLNVAHQHMPTSIWS